MKIRIIAVAILGIFLYSCSPKVIAPVTEVKKVELTPELAAGRTLYENNCAKCHKLYSPTNFSEQDWKPILVRMQKKARLDDAQMVEISNYIYSQL
ncbi:cytochrome c [Flavobacterium sp.]|uniref:cytochrome c n=1 Tax=Flavobacterium sp. TaxID=239 RepID=UPI0038FC97D6